MVRIPVLLPVLASLACGPSPSDPDDTGYSADADPVMDDGWPAQFVAPFADATAYPTVKIGEIQSESGLFRFSLGFIVDATGAACDATWGMYYSIEQGPSAWEGGAEYKLYEQIAALRASGGDVMVSFGGAAGTPLAVSCEHVEDVLAQYERVIDALSLTRIDFDIEGAWVADADSVERRSTALALLQARRAAVGRQLYVSYTLPVLPSGLTADGLAVVRSALDNGVQLARVNVMTMDYGDGSAPDPEGRMGEYGIDAITAVHDQLASIYGAARSDAELWGMIGTTPMIGQNDVTSEFFDLQDAAETRAFAVTVGLGMIGFWSINRDHPCAEETPWATWDCNGSTSIEDWAFSGVFAGYGE